MELSPEKKIAGLLAPLFALRGAHDLGIGDVGALREFVDWAVEQGFTLVQLLPVNETGGDHSPYNAISSVALEPTTIEITPSAVPDLTEADLQELASPAETAPLRAGAVQYPSVKALKSRLLERAYERFLAGSWRSGGARARRFRKFCQAEASWLDGYALFRTLMEENGGTERWDWWPVENQSPEAAATWLAALPGARRRTLELRIRFRKYVQWIAWEQWRAAKEYAGLRGVALMGDIPFGVSYYSADVWAERAVFDPVWSGGCPPERILKVDEFTYKWGQNWGIPLYRWDVLRAADFRWWRQRVHKVRDVFHLFRIDHILGVFRIYGFPWRPERNAEFLPLTEPEAMKLTGGELPHFVEFADDTDAHKAANCAQGEEILRALIEESGAYSLVGEDLGMVPDYVRPCLQELGIAGFKVPQWENLPDGAMIPGAKYERLSLATYATHDHPPLRAMWDDWMAAIAAAEAGGPETWPARDAAWSEVRRFATWCGFEVPRITPFTPEVHESLLRGLFASESWMAVLMITDVFASAQRYNVPGAVSDANWSERLAVRVPEMRAPKWMRTLIAETGRGA
jgi:4-alpha-glucanotransferase